MINSFLLTKVWQNSYTVTFLRLQIKIIGVLFWQEIFLDQEFVLAIIF